MVELLYISRATLAKEKALLQTLRKNFFYISSTVNRNLTWTIRLLGCTNVATILL